MTGLRIRTERWAWFFYEVSFSDDKDYVSCQISDSDKFISVNTRVAIPALPARQALTAFRAANPPLERSRLCRSWVCSPERDCNPKKQPSHPVNPLLAQSMISCYSLRPKVIHGVTHSVVECFFAQTPQSFIFVSGTQSLSGLRSLIQALQQLPQ